MEVSEIIIYRIIFIISKVTDVTFWYQSYLLIVIFYYVNRGVTILVSELFINRNILLCKLGCHNFGIRPGSVPVPTRDGDLWGRGFDSALTRFVGTWL